MSKIRFSHLGVQYEMTTEQIEAAYRYQLHQYRLADAARQLSILAFGLDDPDELDENTRKEDEQTFLDTYGLSYEEAKDMLELFAERFEDDFDCNVDENSAWQNAITNCLA